MHIYKPTYYKPNLNIMKNIFRILMAVAVLLTASCAKEDISSTIASGEANVTFTVDLPELGTRAYGDGSQVKTLRYYVYDGETLLEDLSTEDADEKVTLVKGKASFSLPLLKGMTYNILFWADSDEGHYSVGDNGIITVVNTDGHKIVANDETRDAFFAALKDFDPTEVTGTQSVTLTRPFAQLNAFATDVADVAKSGVTLNKSTITTKIYTTLNPFAAEDAEDVGGLTDVIMFVEGVNPESTNGQHLSMNYLLAPKGRCVANVTFTFNNEQGKTIDPLSLTNIPLQRNYKTNIIGKLLTASTDFTVTIDANFGTPDKIVATDALSLQEAINNAENGEQTQITLGGDIDLNDLMGLFSTRADEPTYGILIPAGKVIVLNLNEGARLYQSKEQTTAYSMIQNNGTLTIKGNGTISYADTGNGGNYVSNTIGNNGTLVVEGCTIVNNSSDDVAANGYPHVIDNNANLTINGGTLTNAKYSTIRIWCTTDDNTAVTINGGTFNGCIDFQTPSASANKGTLTITGGTFNADTYTKCATRLLGFGTDVDEMVANISGGTFKGAIKLNNYVGGEFNSKVYSITGGTFYVDPSEFVAPGYSAVESNGLWSIEFTPEAKIGETPYNTLKDAVAAVQDDETITVNHDITFDENTRTLNSGTWYDGLYYVGDKSFTIDLNGKTIGNDKNAVNDYLFNFKNEGTKANTINIKNGTLDAGTAAFCALCTSTTNTQKITINLDNVNLIGNHSNGAVAKIRGGAELNVNAGTVITGKDSYVGIEAVGNNTVVNINEGAKIYQNGTSSYVGSLAGASNNATLNVLGGEGVSANGGFIVMTSGGTVNISGGNWTANTDGTYANSNKSVLISQSAKGAKCTVNVTGGTFKGGYNCYGDAVGDATINISGGNFNADPKNYLVDGKIATEENGVWTVGNPAAKVGNTTYNTIDEAIAAWTHNATLTLLSDVTLSDVVTLKSTEHHILNLGTYTLTAASGKNAIEIIPNGEGAGTAAKSCLTINADATDPGSIEAGSKACIYYKKTNGINDRIMVTINGGVYNGTISSSSNNGGQACPYFVFNGGTFNKSINLTKAMLKVTGGIFHGMFSCTGDSTSHRLISGGTFKYWTFMTADAANKFAVGTEKQTYNVGVYVDDNGYLVVGGPVITEFGDKFAAKATNATKWSSYLQYSSAAANGLYYTNAEMAIKKHGEANVVLK